MFIYDTEHEMENRLAENASLQTEMLVKIKPILNRYNPFIQTLRQLAQRSDIQDCRLLIRERPVADRQHTLPTASQVAVVLVGADDFMGSNDRDIYVQTTEGQLLNVKDYYGYHDPL
ncbi:hypothetical protein KSP39_PZI023643 [Platanthera zijinensis]|uniref:Uncharacterized protein n=1 Tax=Platanthera zijinensis TaxID=2320716 RepID=A0AAP0FTU9_9ASPA